MAMLNTQGKKKITKMSKASIFMTAVIAVSGCADVDGTPDVGNTEQDVIIGNAIIGNAIIGNAIIGNAIIGNAIIGNAIIGNAIIGNAIIGNGNSVTFSGLSFDPSDKSGIGVAGLGLDEVALDGLMVNGAGSQGITVGGKAMSAEEEASLETVLRYSIECALGLGESVVIYGSDGVAREYQGGLGLAPEWAMSALSALGRRHVSACLAARSNAVGKPVHISLRSDVLTAGPVERAVYSRHEGAFWGNVFGSDPYVQTCVADGAGISGRVCATGDCGYTLVGECADVCAGKDTVDGDFYDCNSDSVVINTFLPITKETAFGQEHGCFADAEGLLWCWGTNGAGQVGDGTIIDRPTPAPRFVDGQQAVEVGGGAMHTCARFAEGSVWCTGDNSRSQLGNGTTGGQTSLFTEVAALGAAVVSLAVGQNHACALMADGTLQCWGDNSHGQLGAGDGNPYSAPTQVVSLGDTVVRVALGESADHSCAVTMAGDLYCWGNNSAGQLGNGGDKDSATPTHVSHDADGKAFTEVTDLCAGAAHTCARRADGQVWCFGNNDKGQLGNTGVTAAMESRPVPVELPEGAIQGGLSCAMDHSCAIVDSGALYCWGSNEQGKLGTDSMLLQSSATPVAVAGLGSTPVASVSADSSHTCAMLRDQSMYCWGQDTSGLLLAGASGNTPTLFVKPEASSYAPASFAVAFGSASGVNTVSWASHMNENLQSYEIYRNGVLLSVPGNKIEEKDRNLSPGTYCYTMRALFSDNTASAFTQEFCGTIN